MELLASRSELQMEGPTTSSGSESTSASESAAASASVSWGLPGEVEELLPPLTVGAVTFSYVRHQRLPHPQLRIQTSKKEAISQEAVAALISYGTQVLERGEPYSCLWDLRSCRVPRAWTLWQLVSWTKANGPALDARLTCVAILTSGPAMRSFVQLALNMIRPRMPQRSFTDEADAFAFTADPWADARRSTASGVGAPRLRLSQLSWLTASEDDVAPKKGGSGGWRCWCCCGGGPSTDVVAVDAGETNHREALLPGDSVGQEAVAADHTRLVAGPPPACATATAAS